MALRSAICYIVTATALKTVLGLLGEIAGILLRLCI